MSGDTLPTTPGAAQPRNALDHFFKISERGSTTRQEILAV
ncbi:putative permease [Atlantibacter hermannii]|nr:putative permease [Atlantibacter hermannii]